MIPINVNAVNRCALSAHTLPRIIALSNPETFASLALAAASLNLWTFCWGVSPDGPDVLCDIVLVRADVVVDRGGFAEA